MKNTEPKFAVYRRVKEHGKPFGAWRFVCNRRLDFTESPWVPQALRFADEVTYRSGGTETRIRPLNNRK